MIPKFPPFYLIALASPLAAATSSDRDAQWDEEQSHSADIFQDGGLMMPATYQDEVSFIQYYSMVTRKQLVKMNHTTLAKKTNRFTRPLSQAAKLKKLINDKAPPGGWWWYDMCMFAFMPLVLFTRCLCHLCLRHQSGTLHYKKSGLGILHTVTATTTLMNSYTYDQRWVFDMDFKHPYDPLIPIGMQAQYLRLWQQAWFVILWLSVGLAWRYELDADMHLRAMSLGGSTLAMAALCISDLFLVNLATVICFSMLMALLISSIDQDFPIWFALRLTIGTVYIFSGLNKINPLWMEEGVQDWMPQWAIQWAFLHHSLWIAGFLFAIGEASVGFALITPWRPLQLLAALGSMAMHIVIIVTLARAGWDYGVMPLNVLCIVFDLTFIFFSSQSKSQPDIKQSVSRDTIQTSTPSARRAFVGLSRAFFFGTLAIVHGFGPASYLLSTNASWPCNGQMALSPYSSNYPAWEIHMTDSEASKYEINSKSALGAVAPMFFPKAGGWRYFNFCEFLDQRARGLAEGCSSAGSTRALLRLGGWVAEQMRLTTEVIIGEKLPMGFKHPSGELPAHRYVCSPICLPVAVATVNTP